MTVTVCLCNVCSLVNIMSLFVYSHDFEIFCVCETWLSDNIHDHEIIYIVKIDLLVVVLSFVSSYHSVTLPSPPDLEVVTVKLGLHHKFVTSMKNIFQKCRGM